MRGPLRRARNYGNVCNAAAWSAPLRIAERPPHPRRPDQVGGSSTSPRAAGRGGIKPSPFSRCAFASEVSPRHGKKALPSSAALQKEGRRAPLGAPRGSVLAAEGLKPAARPASTIASSRYRAGEKRWRPRLTAPTAVMRRRVSPPTRPRAALPGNTGCKREDPPRRQCSEHLALRSRAGGFDAQGRPDKGYKPHPGTAPAPPIGCHRSTSLRWAGILAGN